MIIDNWPTIDPTKAKTTLHMCCMSAMMDLCKILEKNKWFHSIGLNDENELFVYVNSWPPKKDVIYEFQGFKVIFQNIGKVKAL